MKKNLSVILTSLSLLTANAVMAETAYIVDQLLVGLHQDKDIDSPIIKVLSTGTEVDIINREGDFAEIREMNENKIGWVDASYLMLDKPAKVQLIKLQTKIQELESQEGVQATQAIREQHATEVALLKKQIEDLKQNISSEKLKTGELEASISQREKKLAHIEANSGDNRLTALEKINGDLQNQLDLAQRGKTKTYNNQPAILRALEPFKQRTVQISLAILALVAFLLGRRWEDKSNRKRHGGFKV